MHSSVLLLKFSQGVVGLLRSPEQEEAQAKVIPKAQRVQSLCLLIFFPLFLSPLCKATCRKQRDFLCQTHEILGKRKHSEVQRNLLRLNRLKRSRKTRDRNTKFSHNQFRESQLEQIIRLAIIPSNKEEWSPTSDIQHPY